MHVALRLQTHGATPRVARHVSRGLRVVAMRQPRPTDWNARAPRAGDVDSGATRRVGGTWGDMRELFVPRVPICWGPKTALEKRRPFFISSLSAYLSACRDCSGEVQLAAPSLGLGRRGWREDMRALSSHLSQAPPGNEKFPLLLPGICLPRSLVPPLCISGEGTREP